MLGPHTHRDNPLSRIMCDPIAPPVMVLHYENLTTFLFFWKFFSIPQQNEEVEMKKQIRERVTKTLGSGLSRMMRVGNL